MNRSEFIRRWWHCRPQLMVGLLSVAIVLAAMLGHVSALSTARVMAASKVSPRWQHRLQRQHQLGIAKQFELLKLSASQPVDCAQEACIALTFDDGPNPITTPQILQILEVNRVPGTFFVVGSRVGGNESILQRMYRDGDEIGNHSWSHSDFTKLKPDQIKQQIIQTQNAIATAKVPAPKFFRPPYGAVSQAVKDNVDLTFTLWNEDPRDWAANTSQQVATAAEAAAQPGGVVDLHDIYHVTANALPGIIQNLRSRQFHFVTMSQLMGSQAIPPHTEFFGRLAHE